MLHSPHVLVISKVLPPLCVDTKSNSVDKRTEWAVLITGTIRATKYIEEKNGSMVKNGKKTSMVKKE